ncbi:MAG: hypothetical protein IRZ07_20080 [Microbispora sp.]|nr:hypothetical protein [Microbispora sp.]
MTDDLNALREELRRALDTASLLERENTAITAERDRLVDQVWLVAKAAEGRAAKTVHGDAIHKVLDGMKGGA